MIESEVLRSTAAPLSPFPGAELDAHDRDIDELMAGLIDADVGYAPFRDAGYQDCQFRGFHVGSQGQGLVYASKKCRCIAYYFDAALGLKTSTIERAAIDYDFMILEPAVGEANLPGYFQSDRPITMRDFVFEVD